VKNKPPYAIDSVDHALHLATLLQHEGPLRVSEAAERIGVSRSTAHRLLAMLVYRDFAVQGTDRRYHTGSVLSPVGDPATRDVSGLRRVALPHLRGLVAELAETVNLPVRNGTQVRFVESVECDQVLRVGDRAGRLLPAHQASGGKALLARLTAAELDQLYPDRHGGDPDLSRLRRELALVRKRGFAINDQLTETGLTAIGVAIPEADAAVSLAMPSARFDPDRLASWAAALSSAATGITHRLHPREGSATGAEGEPDARAEA
jgi:DNA-binding IclR family transcriptional regulator